MPNLIKVRTNSVYLQLILCWIEAELSEDVSQQFCLHLPRGRGVKLFECFLESKVLGLNSDDDNLIFKNLSLTKAPLLARHNAAGAEKMGLERKGKNRT